MGSPAGGGDGARSTRRVADSDARAGGGRGTDRTDPASRVGGGTAALVARGRDVRVAGERRIDEGRWDSPGGSGGGAETEHGAQWPNGRGAGEQRSDDQEVLPQRRAG